MRYDSTRFSAKPVLIVAIALLSACHPAPPLEVAPNPRFLDSDQMLIPVRLEVRDPEFSGGGPRSVSLNAEPGSYVVVARVTNRSQVEILYPKSPAAQRPYSGTTEEREMRFIPGITEAGAIYALASDQPFDFRKIAASNSWPRPIRRYEGLLASVTTPTLASKLDIIAATFFADITPPSAKIGLDGRLYSMTGAIDVNHLGCRAAESRSGCGPR